MNGTEFLEMINDIDPDLIDIAARANAPAMPSGKIRSWLVFMVPAAIIVAAALLIIGIGNAGRTPNGSDQSMIIADPQTTENNEISEITEQTDSTDDGSKNVQSDARKDNNDEPELQTTIKEATQESEVISEPDSTIEHTDYKETPVYEENGIENDWSEEDTQADYEDPSIYEENDVENDWSEEDTQADYEEPGDNENVITEYRVISIDQASNEEKLIEDEDSWELFWQDNYYNYYMHPGEAEMTFVYYENGELEPLIAALNLGHIEISDLDYYGVSYLKE